MAIRAILRLHCGMPPSAPLRGILSRLRTFLWNQAQYPNPEHIYAKLGLFGITNFLKACWDPTLTNDILRRFGADIHPEAWPIGPHVTLHEAVHDYANLSVGRHAHVGKEVFLYLSERIVIEDGAAVGMRTMIITHLNVGEGYDDNPKQRLFPTKKQPVTIRRGAAVGARCVLLAGVEIGEDAIVNAGVVVEESIPPRTIVRSSRIRDDYAMPERFFQRTKRGS
jgi:acetyltransferase-like isoleucine patch superfamily enzyme